MATDKELRVAAKEGDSSRVIAIANQVSLPPSSASVFVGCGGRETMVLLKTDGPDSAEENESLLNL